MTPILILKYEVVAKYAVLTFRHSIRGITKSALCEYMFCSQFVDMVASYDVRTKI